MQGDIPRRPTRERMDEMVRQIMDESKETLLILAMDDHANPADDDNAVLVYLEYLQEQGRTISPNYLKYVIRTLKRNLR